MNHHQSPIIIIIIARASSSWNWIYPYRYTYTFVKGMECMAEFTQRYGDDHHRPGLESPRRHLSLPALLLLGSAWIAPLWRWLPSPPSLLYVAAAAAAVDELATGILTHETNFGNTFFGRRRGWQQQWMLVYGGGIIEQMLSPGRKVGR